MSRIRPVANGTRTDHPVPGLVFINDERLPLDNPDAIERTGRNQGGGLWGRTDPTRNGGWVAFTTEPKNPAFAWAVYQHPEYGRVVLLIEAGDLGGLHHHWVHEPAGMLFRHGGYWWAGERWHRPGLVWDGAYERNDPREVDNQLTVTAADVLKAPCNPQNAAVAKIASFTAPETPPANWHDHLALWAQLRASQPGVRPLTECVVDLHAPELAADRLVNMAGLANIAAVAEEDMPDLRYEADKLPEPQAEADGAPWWSVPVARDWAENFHQKNGPKSLLAATTSYDTVQPVGLVDAHNRLRKNFHDDLTEQPRGKRRKPYMKGDDAHEAADALAWTAATTLMYGQDQGLIPGGALRKVLIDAVLGHLADDVDQHGGTNDGKRLGDLPADTVRMLVWYFQHRPEAAAGIFGEICLDARLRFGITPVQVGKMLRVSFHLDSDLDSDAVRQLMDMALPPSAREQ
ncbi:hypothetical protein [Streptomyces sp. NBC_01477]|uniref:hypothetical protein n=1 Tax=Streptomyces sp. NBC_01477 TaxID=2976015 RepID=UPI002E35D62A|nr:hypothetical protein [Streptomyces sp. NBC_01477]